MKTIYHKYFIKAYSKLTEKIKDKTDQRLRLFMDNPFATELNNHELSGKYTGHRSININGDLRAIYLPISKDLAHFIRLGTHSELYD